MVRNTFLEPLLWWAYSAVAVTGVFGTLYFCMQQSFRQNLNDPQIQMAEDAARAMTLGASAFDVLPAKQIDMTTSLSPWLAVVDPKGVVVAEGTGKDDPNYRAATSAYLEGDLFAMPGGSTDPSTWLVTKRYFAGFNSSLPETRFTWQPASNVRQAVVLVKLPNGNSIVAGRSMSEIEDRIIDIGFKILFAWLFTLGCLFVASFIGWWLLRRQK